MYNESDFLKLLFYRGVDKAGLAVSHAGGNERVTVSKMLAFYTQLNVIVFIMCTNF